MTRKKRGKKRKYEKGENNRRFLEEEKRLHRSGGRGQSRRDETMRIIEIFQNENSSSNLVVGSPGLMFNEAAGNAYTYSRRSLSWPSHANVRASHLVSRRRRRRQDFSMRQGKSEGPCCTTQPPSPPCRGEEKLFTAVENRENSPATARVGSDEKMERDGGAYNAVPAHYAGNNEEKFETSTVGKWYDICDV